MQQEAAEKLVSGESRNVVRVPRQVLQDMFWAAKGALGVHDPVLPEQRPQKRSEQLWLGETTERAVEAKLPAADQLLKAIHASMQAN